MKFISWLNVVGFMLLLPLTAHSGPEKELGSDPLNWDNFWSYHSNQPLSTFESNAEFNHYRQQTQRKALERDKWWDQAINIKYERERQQRISTTPKPKPLDETTSCEEENCMDNADLERVAVTGSMIASKNPSITNNQELGVEEGDIVKQIDDYLIVLQDGRLFSIDLQTNTNPNLNYVDRVDIYQTPKHDAWYDEMLVTGKRIVVTGYSYGEKASEINILSLGDNGQLILEDTFFLTSDDYYDVDNYATRIIGDKFIVYIPISLEDIETNAAISWPELRYGSQAKAALEQPLQSRQLFNIKDIYKPLQNSLHPTIHSLVICTIGSKQGQLKGLPKCDATSFIAPSIHEMYVSQTEVFIWTSPSWYEGTDITAEENCDFDLKSAFDKLSPSVIYKIPLDGEDLSVVATRGFPYDQFSIDSTKQHLRALTGLMTHTCDSPDTNDLAFYQVPHSHFSNRLRLPDSDLLTTLPSVDIEFSIENRFTEDYLVYAAALSWWSGGPPSEDEIHTDVPLFAVALNDPSQVKMLSLPHSVIRLEVAGSNMVTTGYSDDSGLKVSAVNLNDSAHIASTIHLEKQYESEGRSHAFNSIFHKDGSGYLGIPTVTKKEGADRWWWNSASSDLTFMKLTSRQHINSLGVLSSRADSVHAEYQCEVSCIDWYGNSRPIFTNNRIFALSGTEIIEGEIIGDNIQEVRRVNLTVPPTP